jgi:hypothetical protein
MDFHEIWYLSTFQKTLEKIEVSLNVTRITGTLHEDQYTLLIIARSFILRMRKLSEKSWREKSKYTFYIQKLFFFRKSCLLWVNVQKYCRAGETTDDNMAHAHYMLDDLRLPHILICNTYCFTTTINVVWTPLNITIYVPCVSCYTYRDFVYKIAFLANSHIL